ncbi:MAG: peptidoglycan-binding domain-containing protein [Candidatus Nanopelagicales bacterium]
MSRIRRLSVTVTVLALLAVGGLMAVVRPAAEVAPVAASTPTTAPTPAATEAEVEQKLREALATVGDEPPAVTAEPPAAEAIAAPATSEPEQPVAKEATPKARSAAAEDESAGLPAEDLPVASEGDYGTVVEVAQRALDVEPTGYFGPKTKSAVAEYQEAIGLPATGQIATFTWSALGAETVAAALEAAATADGFVDGEPADIQESAQAEPETQTRTAKASDAPVLEETDQGEAVAVVQRALGVKPATGARQSRCDGPRHLRHGLRSRCVQEHGQWGQQLRWKQQRGQQLQQQRWQQWWGRGQRQPLLPGQELLLRRWSRRPASGWPLPCRPGPHGLAR